MDMALILSAYIKQAEGQIFFIQIGANDGTKDDAIVKFVKENRWQGILVEPVKYLFDKLIITYAGYDLILENSAITNSNGLGQIFRLENNDLPLPLWFDGLASFDKNILLSHNLDITDIDSLIIEETVNTITWNSLIDKYKVNKINILHIDTEGYDWDIIKMIEFDKIQPEIIIYEYHHLTVYNCNKSIIYLKNNGYYVFRSSNSYDIIAISKAISYI